MAEIYARSFFSPRHPWWLTERHKLLNWLADYLENHYLFDDRNFQDYIDTRSFCFSKTMCVSIWLCFWCRKTLEPGALTFLENFEWIEVFKVGHFCQAIIIFFSNEKKNTLKFASLIKFQIVLLFSYATFCENVIKCVKSSETIFVGSNLWKTKIFCFLNTYVVFIKSMLL